MSWEDNGYHCREALCEIAMRSEEPTKSRMLRLLASYRYRKNHLIWEQKNRKEKGE